MISTIGFLQHPETQHVLTGDNPTFSCAASHAYSIIWLASFTNGSFAVLTENSQNIMLTDSQDNTNTTITINARETWNETRLQCQAEYLGADYFSNEAYLIVYSSLSKYLSLPLSPSPPLSLPPPSPPPLSFCKNLKHLYD